MNDFTKEELEGMLWAFKATQQYTGINNWGIDLYDKIQSMIENYHEIKLPTMDDYE